jgi:hypothetical protein
MTNNQTLFAVPDQTLLTLKDEQYLRDLYFNPESPVSYSGINKIYKKTVNDGYKILEKLWFPILINNGKHI